MPLDVKRAVGEAVRRTVKRNGLLLAAIFLLLDLIWRFTGLQSGTMAAVATEEPFQVGVPGVIVVLLSFPVTIAALRVFVTDETETVPDNAWKDKMGRAIIHFAIGAFVYGVLAGIGSLLFLLPGVYLMLALFFFMTYIAVENQGFYEAMQSSWGLTKGHKWRLLGLLIVIVVVARGLPLLGRLAFTLWSGPSLGFTYNALIQEQLLKAGVQSTLEAFGGVFALAVQARAYVQLAETG